MKGNREIKDEKKRCEHFPIHICVEMTPTFWPFGDL